MRRITNIDNVCSAASGSSGDECGNDRPSFFFSFFHNNDEVVASAAYPMTTPLFLLSMTLCTVAILTSHAKMCKRMTLASLGKVGHRGRRYYSTNEMVTTATTTTTGSRACRCGDVGDYIIDYWLYGGTVYVRALYAVLDIMKNVYGTATAAAAGTKHTARTEKERRQHPSSSSSVVVGSIIGYDTNLGAHGTFTLLALRASFVLFVWHALFVFIIATRDECARYINNTNMLPPTVVDDDDNDDNNHDGYRYAASAVVALYNMIRNNIIRSLVVSLNYVIYYAATTATAMMMTSRIPFVSTMISHDDDMTDRIIISTILLACVIITISELLLYSIGRAVIIFNVHVPTGTSDPGRPRVRKIQRMGNWTDEISKLCSSATPSSSSLPTTAGDDDLVSKRQRWRCAVGHDSHNDTNIKFGFSGKNKEGVSTTTTTTSSSSSGLLTGEPFGRQIWTTTAAATTMAYAIPPPHQHRETIDTRMMGEEGEDEDEDLLENKLMTEFPLSTTKITKTTTREITNSFTEAMSNVPNFFQNILSPGGGSGGGSGSSSSNKQRSNSNNGVKKRNTKKEDEQLLLIQTLASGGRPYLEFNPSSNPNSCDQLFRAQMIESYLEKSGGDLPYDIAYLQRRQNNNTYDGVTKKNRGRKRPDKNEMKDEQDEEEEEEEEEKYLSKSAMDAARRGIAFYSMLQTPDGHWAGDYGGPHFLLPGLVVAWYVMDRPTLIICPAQQGLMLHYLMVHQQTDGGWGTHIESPSTMFGTVLCYLAARLLGARKDEVWIARGRRFIQSEGGAVMTSSWAKFWLCLVGCMDWRGHNSVPPEMWLLPNWSPFHPGRLWCHCRMVYLPMGYLYGSRYVYAHAETDPLIKELREELYCTEAYDTIDWDSTRHLVAEMDNYSPIPRIMTLAQNCLSIYENWAFFRPFRDVVRKAGLVYSLEYMHAEDLQTNYINIGPVNKVLNMISAYHASNDDIHALAVRQHMMRIPDYLWIAEDGMKMQGYNGSQCWDTSFAIQAVWECDMLDRFPLLSTKVWSYLERTQILSTNTSQSSPAYEYEGCINRDRFYRHVSKGGWPFSTSAHGWPISDCTGEGLKGVLALMDSPAVMGAVKKGLVKDIEPCRLYDAVNVLLTLQNEDGGWATYENNRGFSWYEELNPSEVFGDIMIDYSYVECSMASLSALAEFHEKFPYHRVNEIRLALRRGAEFIISIQREDGSWYGSWACCFTYGCWFGIEGLIKAGEPRSSPNVTKCCTFLLSQQRPNGGWGEDFTSCYDKDYAKEGMQSYGDDGSGVVNTAWALMALSAARCSDLSAIRRGVQYLMTRQLDCGDFPQEGISGVFNRSVGITYTAYRNIFPIWALGRCSKFLHESEMEVPRNIHNS